MAEIRLSVLDELTPGEAVLLEHFRALPLDERQALLNMLDRAAEAAGAGARPLAFLYRDSSWPDTRLFGVPVRDPDPDHRPAYPAE